MVVALAPEKHFSIGRPVHLLQTEQMQRMFTCDVWQSRMLLLSSQKV